ncbi:MAG: TIGR02757 family protein, partial [Bacteroidia bacterium]|nr:TIGR02757 family protein [Bacteroidia bacterium]
DDAVYFIRSLKNIYTNHEGLSGIFKTHTRKTDDNLSASITELKKVFYSASAHRTTKHLPDPLANSSAKRINMFLRWMVRNDERGVDFGLWNFISPAQLSIPLDVHSGNVARKLGLLKRKQNDWKAVTELTLRLKEFDKHDPVKYDFALFGLGVFEKF